MSSARPILIGHEWKQTALTIPVMNPFTREKVAEVCQAGKEEAEEAVATAVKGVSLDASATFPCQSHCPGKDCRWPR